jgi:hypothetical protein
MSEQGRQPDHQSEQPNLADEDYQKADEMLRLALAKLRLLNNPEHPLSLREILSRAHRLAEPYQRWEQSGTPIKGIDLRLSNGEKLPLDQTGNKCQFRMRLQDGLPPGAVLEIWKEADEHFDEVLLKCWQLSEIPPEGMRFEKVYPNGQTLSLEVNVHSGEDISISGEFTVQEAQRREHAPRPRDVWSPLKWLRNVQMAHPAVSLAVAMLLLLTVGTLFSAVWRDNQRMQVEQEIALLQAPRGISTQTVIIMPYAALRSVERGGSSIEELDVSTATIHLLLQLPPGEIAESYEATLTDALDRTLFTVRQLRCDNSYVSLILSKQSIPTGSYRLALSHDDEAPIYYEFNIVKRSRAQPPDQD